MDRSLRGLINNKNGSLFESEIIGGCMAYNLQERAFIEKTPEPFKVSKPLENGFFKGRFTSKSQPDFKGTLRNGLSIVFEAKYLNTHLQIKFVQMCLQKIKWSAWKGTIN